MPVLRFHPLTPLYDRLICLLLPERIFKQALLTQAALQPGKNVLDFGCGTGTLLQMACKEQPQAHYYGLDADPQVLRIAARKLNQAAGKQTIRWVHYEGKQVPFPDNSFDTLLASLLFCNLTPAQKRIVIGEMHRALKRNGTLHIVEWGRPGGFWVRPGFWLLQAVGGFVTTRDLAANQLPAYLEASGFQVVQERLLMNTWCGTLYMYEVEKLDNAGKNGSEGGCTSGLNAHR